MDSIAGLSTGLALASVSGSLNVDVLKSVQNLSMSESSILMSSLGIGSHVDSLA